MSHTKSNISTLEIDGLKGRMLHLPAPKGKQKKILLIYGLHASLERMQSTAEFLNRYGEVVMPDFPGFGGMDSFYKQKKKPTPDSYADYLYTFMKANNLTKDVTVVSMSFGFITVTRMLQKYPDSVAFFRHNIGYVAFGSEKDFSTPPVIRKIFAVLSSFFSTRIMSLLVEKLVFNPISLRAMFATFRLVNPKYQVALGEERDAATAMELDLWQKNDARTKFYTYKVIYTFNLTKHGKQIPMSAYNMQTATDQYFSSEQVNATMNQLYKTYHPVVADSVLHAPSVLGDVDEIDVMFSTDIKKLLLED